MRPLRFHAWLCCLSALLASCTSVREFPAPPLSSPSFLKDPGSTGAVLPAVHSERAAHGAPSGPQVSHVLVLSEGGFNGAFPSGLLKGWTEAGTRPKFDVVTGISAGALIAPFAFLGAEHDEALERAFASAESAKFYRWRRWLALPWAASLAHAEPLQRRIDAEVTDDLLRQIAREHRMGRRLLVGTTNLDSQRLVVWDLGAIAANDDPDKRQLFCEVLLASCSVPGLLPPVPINVEIDGKPHTELHADGGICATLFLPPQMLGCATEQHTSHPGGTTRVYVVVAGKLEPEHATVRHRLWNVTEASLRGMKHAQLENDLQRLFQSAHSAGAQVQLAAIPRHMSAGSMTFDAMRMRQLFEVGRQFGLADRPWITVPPGATPGEWQTPRTGISIRNGKSAVPDSDDHLQSVPEE